MKLILFLISITSLSAIGASDFPLFETGQTSSGNRNVDIESQLKSIIAIKFKEPEKVISLSLELLKSSSNLKPITKVTIFNELSTAYRTISKYPESIDYANKALELSLSIADRKNELRARFNVGAVKYLKGEFTEAQSQLVDLVKKFESIADWEYQVRTMLAYGATFAETGNYENALKIYYKALPLSGNLYPNILKGNIHIQIGGIHYYLGDFEEAIKEYSLAIHLLENHGVVKDIAIANANIAEAYIELNELKASLTYAEEAVAISEKHSLLDVASFTYNLLGSIYSQMGNQPMAISYLDKGYELAVDNGNPSRISIALLAIAKTLRSFYEFDKASEKASEALVIAEENSDLMRLRETHQLLAGLMEEVGSFELAVNHLKEYQKYEKQLFNAASDRNIRELQTEYEVEKANHEINLLKRDKLLEQQKVEAQRTKQLFVVTSMLLAFVLVFLFYRRRQAIVTQKQLEDLVEQKTNALLISNKSIIKLGHIGQRITSTLDLERVFELVYQHVNELVDATTFMIGIMDRKNEDICFRFAIEGGQKLPEYRDSLNETKRPAVHCVVKGVELVFNKTADMRDVLGEESKPKEGVATKSMIYLPLKVNNETIGCITIQSPKEQAYSDNDIEIMRTIANYSAIALSNADSHENLERTLGDLTRTQNQLIQQEKMAGLGTLTAGVMHEINNPTNFAHASLYNLTHKLEELFGLLTKLAGGDNAPADVLTMFKDKRRELEQIVCTAKEGTTRIKQIVEDFSGYSRLETEEKNSVDIDTLVSSSINLVRTKYPEIEFDLERVSSIQIDCYQSKLSQVFLNILVNGCQAIKQTQLSNNNILGMIKVSTETATSEVVITISDNGIGMDEETLTRVFEPFFTTKEVGTGTGLGMAISYGVIEKHKGHIEIESAINQGTIVRLHLPNTVD